MSSWSFLDVDGKRRLAAFVALLLLSYVRTSFSFGLSTRQFPVRPSNSCLPPIANGHRSTSLVFQQSSSESDDIAAVERDVVSSTRARLDWQRVTSLFEDESVDHSLDKEQFTSPWSVALAAGIVTSGLAYAAVHNWILSIIVFAAVALVANRDPLDEDSAAGAAARVVGRVTLQSVKASQPKVRAIARAAVRGEEDVRALKQRMQLLEDENARLRLWKQRRNAVDDALPNYTLDELRDKARFAGLTVGGTKVQLLMRLVEAEVVTL